MATKPAPYPMTAAGARARAKVGHSTLGSKIGQCLAECVNPANSSPYSIPSPWRFAGNGERWAINYWLAAVKYGKVVKTSSTANIPKGALIFFVNNADKGKTAPSGPGHVSIYDEAGYTDSTDFPSGKWGRVTVKHIEETWGKTLVGYILVTGDGYDLRDPAGTAPQPPTAVWGKAETFVLGATGADVTKLGERIVAWSKTLGLPAPYKTGPGSPLGTADITGLKAIQTAWGWTGADADGYPGPETFTRLAGTPTAKPKTETLKVMFLPMAGYNGDGEKGVTAWKANVKGLAALVNKHKPDLIGTTELSNRAQDPMLHPFDAALPNYAREGGSDGRYIYRRIAATNHVGAGVVSAASSTLLNGDDKQAAWSVDETLGGTRVGTISAHTENQDGVDHTTGKNADQLRPEQLKSMLSKAKVRLAADHVTDEHTILLADTNSVQLAKDALVALGWTAIGPGYFHGWDDHTKKTFDWAFIKGGTATVQVINHEFSDHTALLITWTFPV